MTQKISWNLTCVSAYWKVNNKHGNNYEQWFHTTLKVHCPYVFFSAVWVPYCAGAKI